MIVWKLSLGTVTITIRGESRWLFDFRQLLLLLDSEDFLLRTGDAEDCVADIGGLERKLIADSVSQDVMKYPAMLLIGLSILLDSLSMIPS